MILLPEVLSILGTDKFPVIIIGSTFSVPPSNYLLLIAILNRCLTRGSSKNFFSPVHLKMSPFKNFLSFSSFVSNCMVS